MIPKAFDYYAPTTLTEAVGLLQRKGTQSKLLAGGQSLIALMKLRVLSPPCIIDLKRIPGLSYIEEQGNCFRIGALTTYDSIDRSSAIRQRLPILAEAASLVGDQQIRSRGTVGGTSCHADPAADMPPVFLALQAEFVVVGPHGERMISATDFFLDYFSTALRPDEILREIRIPFLPSRSGTAYVKHVSREGGFAVVGVAACLVLNSEGVTHDVRIALCGVATTPTRAKAAEEILLGKTLTEAILMQAAKKGLDGTNPPSDANTTAEYRKTLIPIIITRATRLARARISQA